MQSTGTTPAGGHGRASRDAWAALEESVRRFGAAMNLYHTTTGGLGVREARVHDAEVGVKAAARAYALEVAEPLAEARLLARFERAG